MDPVAGEDGRAPGVHADRDGDDQGPPGVAKPFMDVLVELDPGGGLVELGQGRPQHGGVELGFLCHERPFR